MKKTRVKEMHTHLHFQQSDWHPWLSKSARQMYLKRVNQKKKKKLDEQTLFVLKTYLTTLCISTTRSIMEGGASSTCIVTTG